jgi:chromosome segregation ATPase
MTALDDNSLDLSLPESFDADSGEEDEGAFGAKTKASWLKEQKASLLALQFPSMQRITTDDLTIPELVELIIHDKVQCAEKTLRAESRNFREMLENTQLDLEESRNGRKMSDKRNAQIRDEINVSEGIQQDLEAKVRDLQEKNMGYRERERHHESLKLKCKTFEDDMQSLRATIDRQNSLLKETEKAEKETLQRLIEAEKKMQSAATESSFLQRENALLSDRVERAETELHKTEAGQRLATRKYEEVSLAMSQLRDQCRKEFDNALAAEVARAREEGSNEMAKLYNDRLDSWGKENASLREAKQKLEHELVNVKKQNHNVRSEHDKELLQCSRTSGEGKILMAELK